MSMIDPKGSGDMSKALAMIRAHRSQKPVATAVVHTLHRHLNSQCYEEDKASQQRLKMMENQR
jgi:hypothetical protein